MVKCMVQIDQTYPGTRKELRIITRPHVQLVGVMLAYSNALEGLKSTQDALRRLMSDPLTTDEPDLGSRAVPIDT